jgi:SAM-dependent methyltransferase
MSAADYARRLPRPLRRQILHFEAAIEDAVIKFASSLGRNARVLDAGAGETQYARWFHAQRYIGVDLAVGDSSWDYTRLSAIADLSALPFADHSFDAAINIVTLEHVLDPMAALHEIARTLRPRAALLLVVPLEWEVHQSPHDYFRFTRHGLEHLLGSTGFVDLRIIPVGGYFRLLSRRLMNGLQFFVRGWRWVLFPAAALLIAPFAFVAPMFDWLDDKQNFTLGYICTAARSTLELHGNE